MINNRIPDWTGPHTVESFEPQRKIVHVRDKDTNVVKRFNVFIVKHYNRSEVLPDTPVSELSHAFFADIGNTLRPLASPPEEQLIRLTEIIDPNDPRAKSIKMTEAKRKEIKGLLDRDLGHRTP